MRRRGIALVVVLFVTFVVVVIAFAAASVTTLEGRDVDAQTQQTKALDLARAGLVRATTQLASTFTWASSPLTFTLGDGSYTVTSVQLTSNTGSALKWWKVTSTGSVRNATRTLVAWLQAESFAKYAYFTNSEVSSLTGSTLFFVGSDHIVGPVHTNGYFSFQGHPQFSDRITSANSGDADYSLSTSTYKQGTTSTTDPTKFYRYSSSYTADGPVTYNNSSSFKFSGGNSQVTLPSDVSSVKSNASLSYSGNVTVAFSSAGTMTVTDATTGKSAIYPSASATIYAGGQVSVSGTVKGHVTIGSATNIAINGSLNYADKTADSLGLIAQNNVTVSTPLTAGDVEVDAYVMALNGAFSVDNYSAGPARGTLHVFGGIVQKLRGPVGTFDSSTGTVMTGFVKDYQYDSKLLDQPPPNFPVTSGVKVQSVIDQGALGH